jgi:hypothetical protein
MPEGKYIRITYKGETKEITDLTGWSNHCYFYATFADGFILWTTLTNKTSDGYASRNQLYFHASAPTDPSFNIEPYLGETYTIELVSGELKQLDEKYIPNTIARVADIENIPIITPDMIMAMLDEVQLAQPVADADNSVLTTDDDKILIL